ncbi:RecQ family zinc-binding domain-containing protein [Methanoculleus sp. 10]|uniref:RecQ family zinc-binding domain-containing protein n=1 Tax=Methanoculleus sp. 10 TaxID=430615 RepID=UPI00344ACBDA
MHRCGAKDVAYRKAGRSDYCETAGCRRKFLLTYFGEDYPGSGAAGATGARRR